MRTLYILIMASLGFAQGVCQNRPSQDRSLSFILDNDLFANTDKDYTNGARVSFITNKRVSPNFKDVAAWLESVQSRVPDSITGFDKEKKPEYRIGYSVTQLMFTPNDFESSSQPPGEHPYVGWLAIGYSLHAKTEKAINSLEISLGLTGRNAFAEATQDFIHDLRNIEKFNGWDSQMPSEATLNLFFTQKRRLTGNKSKDVLFDIDSFGEWELAVGNFKSSVDLGLVMRAGFHLPVYFSDPRIGPTSYSHEIFYDKKTDTKPWSAFGIFGARGSAILHDISLDGPLFRTFETGVEKEDFVGEAYLGAAIRLYKWELSYVHTFRSKRFKEQPKGSQFGSIALRRKY